MNTSEATAPIEPPRAGFWKRRVVLPIVAQFRRGITPEKIALTLALGTMLGVFPILGATMLLSAVPAALLRLNQPIIQLVNYFACPLQLALIIPFYRAGEMLFGQKPVTLSIPMLFDRCRADFWQFLQDFGQIAVQGIVVWCLLAPAVVAALYWMLRPPLRLLARRSLAK